VMLLLLFSAAVAIGAGTVIFVIRQTRLRRERELHLGSCELDLPYAHPPRSMFLVRPTAWLAIKSRSLRAVQSALGLHNVKPCSFIEGLAGEEKLFIAPPVKGWILVFGAGLPDPSDDVDASFRFLLNLSRKLGEVQFFSASRILHEHAWVRADRGHVVRAYAWSGRTLWNQGRRTASERALGLKCFDYAEVADCNSFSEPDVVAANVDKVPLLAARWSLDPACIDERFLQEERGIAGDPSRRY